MISKEEAIKVAGKRLESAINRLYQAIGQLNRGWDGSCQVIWHENAFSGHSLAIKNCSEGDYNFLVELAKTGIEDPSSAGLKALGQPRFVRVGLTDVTYFSKIQRK